MSKIQTTNRELLGIHNRAFHRDQQFHEGLKPKEHRCKKEKEKLNCGNLTETNIKGQPKYRDEKRCEYSDIESFQNRTMLPEVEIQENQRKRKGNIQSPNEEQRAIKVRETSRVEEKMGEEGREEANKKKQEGEITESVSLPQLVPHIQ